MTAATRRTRKFPFLHRNWIKSTNHWHAKMGNKISSLSPGSGDRFPDQEDHPQPPLKRRRVAANNDYDGFPLFPGYANTSSTMRLEILKMNHKDSPRFKNGNPGPQGVPQNVRLLKARCKITIFSQRAGQHVFLHVDSQLCDINIYKNPAAVFPIARLNAIKPFNIPAEKIFLQREDDDLSFGLANSYSVMIELEPVGDPKWPPFELIPMNDDETFSNRFLPPRSWVLTATIPDIFNDRHRDSIRLKVRKQNNQEITTNFNMEVDVRWITAISSQLTMKEKNILPSITVFDPNEPVITTVNASTNEVNGNTGDIDMVNGEVDILAVQTHGAGSYPLDELAEGELTPSRSRRTRRLSINYNVRQLWNTAVGKEKTRKRQRSPDKQGQTDDHTIIYKVHPECFQISRFQCVLCAAEHDRISQLRAHALSHPNYDFQFDYKATEGWVAVVRPTNTNNENANNVLKGRTFQLGLPTKPLDLDSFVDGDTSWVDSRLGPENYGASQEMPPPQIRPIQKWAIKRPRKKILVPNTRQPLYDPLSKAQLVPGSEIRQIPVDDEWLVLKHRDTLQDFTDVEESEKEYMKEWDAFILKQHLSSEAYIPRAFLIFVKEKASWITAQGSRVDEFSKHVTVLLGRQAIDETTLREAAAKINEARTNKVVEPPKLEPPRRVDAADCAVCGQLVPMSGMVVCANKQCPNRVYHDTCVDDPDDAMQRGLHWRCRPCS